MSSREQFEAWVLGRQVCKKYGAKLIKDSAGSYLDYRINDRWLAWTASRAAIEIDLSEALNTAQTEYESEITVYNQCADAIALADLKVKS